MPTLNNYTYEFLDGQAEKPMLVEKPRFEYPLVNDSSIYLMVETYEQLQDFYEPLQPNEMHPTINALYFVKDTPLNPVGNGVGRWERTWAILPGADTLRDSFVYSEYEEYLYRVPGIASTQGLFLAAVVQSWSVSGGNHTITAIDTHDVSVGDRVTINYSTKDPQNGFTYIRSQVKVALAGTAGAVLVVSQILDINTVTPITFHRAITNQDPYDRKVISRLDYDWWLPGVNIERMDDIPIIHKTEIIDTETGNRTESLRDISPPTVPSLTQYTAWIEQNQWIPVEDSIIERWQGSNIYQRITRYVKAIL
jgi:hypothetical protein